jgi:hypothetical protein
MSFAAQLLPDMDQARLFREAMDEWIRNHSDRVDDVDKLWALLAKLTDDMKRYR